MQHGNVTWENVGFFQADNEGENRTSMSNLYPVLTGQVVTLHPLQLEHAHDLHCANDPRIWTNMLTKVETLEQMKQWVGTPIHWRDKGTAIPFVVQENNTDQFIGSTRIFSLDLKNRSCELGSTWYHPDYWGTRVNKECKYLILRYCFEELGLYRVQIKTDQRNTRSQRAIERLGATKEGVLRKERVLDDGYIRNAVVYSIIDDEWSLIKEQLEKKLCEIR